MERKLVAPVRYAPLCRLCKRDLEANATAERANGRVTIELRCPKHGRVKRGERYLTGYVPDEPQPEE